MICKFEKNFGFVLNIINNSVVQSKLNILIINSLIGFLVGFFIYPTWQVCVETGQVLSGIVLYDTNAPNYFYHSNIWNLPSQLSGLLLYVGLTEETVSKIMSGLIFSLAFSGLGGVFFMVTSSIPYSILYPFLFTIFIKTFPLGNVYPVLLDTVNSFGQFGLYLSILIIALYFLNFRVASLFFFGLLLSVHIPHFLFFASVFLIFFVFDTIKIRKTRVNINKKSILPILLGFFISILSFTLQHFITDTPETYGSITDIEKEKQLFENFIINYDHHRREFNFKHYSFIFLVMAFAVSYASYLKKHIKPEVFLFCLTLFFTSIFFVFITLIPKELLDSRIYALMPGRFINVYNVLMVTYTFALIYTLNRNIDKNSLFWLLIFIVLFLAEIVLNRFRIITLGKQISYGHVEALALVCLPVVLFMFLSIQKHKFKLGNLLSNNIIVFISKMSFLVLLFVIVYSLYNNMHERKHLANEYEDIKAFFDNIDIKGSKGHLIVSSGNDFFQLKTRLPVLVDTILDGFSYFPTYTKTLNRYTKDLYGLDLSQKPEEEDRNTGIITEKHLEYWESLSESDWLNLAEQYNIKYVVCGSNCNLDLRIEFVNEGYKIFAINDLGESF